MDVSGVTVILLAWATVFVIGFTTDVLLARYYRNRRR